MGAIESCVVPSGSTELFIVLSALALESSLRPLLPRMIVLSTDLFAERFFMGMAPGSLPFRLGFIAEAA